MYSIGTRVGNFRELVSGRAFFTIKSVNVIFKMNNEPEWVGVDHVQCA